jgi:beta-lactam-binding protein with PASTA domain
VAGNASRLTRGRVSAVLMGIAALAVVCVSIASSATRPETTSSVRVPKIVGKKLPLAEYLIRQAGLRVGREDCDCTFGVVIKSNWYVCIQSPRAGRMVARRTRVNTYSERSRSDC